MSFQDSVDGGDDVSSSLPCSAAKKSDDTAAAVVAEASPSPVAPDNTDSCSSQSIIISHSNNSTGNQVVHRHVNGLCIITAGNILQTILQQQQQQNSTSIEGSSQHQPIISSIKYLVEVAPDAQSAKGKLRAKNKKRKKKNSTDSCQAQDANCGDVTPTDALCEVTLANGDKVILKCCVQGTIIELNHRLATNGAVEKKKKQQSSNSASVDGSSSSNSNDDVDGSASLLLTDPLLDGYLAVIMPNRGTQLPTL